MDQIYLEIDQPGTIVSFHLNSEILHGKIKAKETVEVNFRHIFKRLVGRKKATQLTVKPMEGSPQKQASGDIAPESSRSMFKSSNTFDSIIDKLERKYYHAAQVDDFEESSMTSDGTDSVSSRLHTPDATQQLSKSKKRKISADDYDYSDPFIDDHEEVQEYEGAIAAKRKKAQKSGYYVSSGEGESSAVLTNEVVFRATGTNETASSNKEKSKQSVGVVMNAVISKDKESKGSKDRGTTASSMESKGKVPTKNKNTVKAAAIVEQSATVTVSIPLTIVEAPTESPAEELKGKMDVVPSLPPDPDTTSNHLDSGEIGTDATKSDGKRHRTVAPKCSWVPHEDVVSMLEAFKAEVERFNPSTLKKASPYPSALEQSLLNLHAEVLKYHDQKELNKTIGFHEYIGACFGPYFPAGRIKIIISRLHAKDNSNKRKAFLMSLVETFKTELKAAIIVCPEDKKVQKKEMKTAKDKKESGIVEGVEEMDVDVIDGQARKVQDQVVDRPSIESTNTAAKDNAGSQISSNETVAFVWFCKWTLALRQRLVELLDLTAQWTKAENEYRSKLVVADKKEMTPDEVYLIDIKI